MYKGVTFIISHTRSRGTRDLVRRSMEMRFVRAHLGEPRRRSTECWLDGGTETRQSGRIRGTWGREPSQYCDVGLHHSLGAMAVALDDHLEVFVAEEVGDFA